MMDEYRVTITETDGRKTVNVTRGNGTDKGLWIAGREAPSETPTIDLLTAAFGDFKL